MATNGGRIDYTIGFKLDKKGIEGAKQALQEIQKLTPQKLVQMNPSEFGKGLNEATKTVIKLKDYAKELQLAFTKAFNPLTGQTNLVKLNQELNADTVRKFANECSRIGIEGEKAFLQFSSGALTANTQIAKTKSLLDSMGETLTNTLKWSLSSSLINRFVGSFQQAYGYVQHLDTSLNDIRIVTGKSADEMDRFALQANEAAQVLGKATTDYTEAALIYYQQGLSDEEVQARTETTLKAANVTGQATSTVSEQLTAVWNGYRVSAENTEEAVDKLAAVAATTAADLEELSTGMSKVAAAANSMGVDMDQLNATIATIESVTRQAPESVGTALKTIYARMGDLKLGATDEDGLGLGQVSGTLEKVGIHILDVNGDLRDMGTVIEEIGAKWDTWTKAEQTAIAEAVAGKRQYNNLFALFENWDMYNKALETSRNSIGTLQNQQDIFMESTAAHVQKLKTQWEDFYDSILDTSTINDLIDALTKAVALLTQFIDSIGGGTNAIVMLGSTLTSVFSKQIGSEIGNLVLRFKDAKEASQQLTGQLQILEKIKQSQGANFTGTKELIESYDKIKEYYNVLDESSLEQANNLAKQVAEAAMLKKEFEEIGDVVNQYVNTNIDDLTKENLGGEYNFFNNEEDSKLLKDSLNEDYKRLTEMSKSFKGLQTDGLKLIDILHEMESVETISPADYRETNIIWDNVEETAKQMETAIKGLSKGFLTANPEIEKFVQILQRIQKSEYLDEIEPAIYELQEAFNNATPQAQKFLDDLFKMQMAGNEAADSLNAAKQARDAFLDRQTVLAYAQAWTQLVAGLGQYITSLNALSNIGSIITDDDLTTGEKFKQILSSMIFTLPMLLSSIKSVTIAIGTLTGVETKDLTVKQIWSAVTKKLTFENMTLAGALKAVGLAVKSIPVIGWILAGLAATITVVTTAFKGYQKQLEKNAEEEKENLRVQQEKINKTKEEKEAIDNLANSYQELLNQKDAEGKFTKEQEAQIYNLIKAYGDQELIIQALAGDYDSLTNSIKKVQEAENDRLKQELETGINLSQSSLEANIKANAKMTQRDREGFDLSSSATSEENKKFREELAALIGKENEEIIDIWGHINYEDLEEILTSDTDKLLDLLNKYKDSDITENLRKLLSQENETINQIKEDKKSLKEAELNALGYLSADDIDKIDDLTSYIQQIDALAQEALENGYVDSYEEGREWAKQFLAGYKDEFNIMDAKDTVVQAIADTFDNEDAAILSKILQQGGNVDLLNRPILEREDGSYSTVSTITAGDESTGYINFTPIFVNPETGKAEELTDEALNEYIDTVLASEDPISADTKGLIIGGVHETLEEAEVAAQTIHELQDQYYQYEDIALGIADSFKNVSDAGLQAIANHTDLFRLLYNEGWSLDDIVKNLSNEIDIITNEDHIVKIDAVIDKKFAEKELQELFNDTTFEIPFTKDDFAEFDDSSKYQALIALRQQEINSIEEKIELERIDVKERTEALNNQIDLETKQIELLRKQASENWHTLAEYKAIARQIHTYEDNIASAKDELEKLTDYHIDFSKQVELVKEGIKKLNTDIDNIQSSYQSLQSVIEDYNDDGYLTLDNLQKILELDDAYVASLQLENGQMSINEETSRAMIDAKLHLAEVEATELYLSELEAIAHNENVIASQNAYNADMLTVSGINDVIKAAGQGVDALMNYAAAKDAASVDYNATKTATEAYYNRMQLIKNVASQPTSSILGKTDKSKSKSGSSKEAKTEKHLEREEDIYRTINEELEQIESTLGRIQTINDHEWGIDAQKTLEAENELLDKQLDKLKQKKALHEKDLSVRRRQLEDVGVTFTEDGSAMTNAEAKLNAFYAHYNSMVDAYNAMSAAEQETYKAQLDAEKDRIDKIEQKINDYESGFSDYQSTLDALLDAHYAEIENEVKLFNNMVDVHLELNDAKKEWDDFWYDVVQDVQDSDFGGQIAKSMAKLETLVGNTISNTDSDVSVLTNHLLDTIAEVQAQIASKDRGGEDSLFGDDTAASKENLENYRDKLMSALTAAKEEIDNISETYLKMLDDAQDKIDKQVDGWNSIGDQIDHDLELIKLISGEKAFAPLNNFLEQQYKNDLNLINTQKQSQDFWRQQIDRYTELLNVTEEGTVQWKTYSEALEKASENYRKAVNDLDKTVEEALKHLDEWRENQVSAITTALDNAMSGGLGLDLVEQEWKLINEYSEKYLDNVERALDMEEYTNILNDAAEATGLTAANQEKLNRFRDEELKKLNAKEKLTSYDIEESKARLEILKQELALEDARQNKSNMRLRRDSQGNYVYQYVSNEEDIEKANNGLLTAKREWYELVKKRYKETSDWIIDLEKQQASLLQQIDEAEKNGEIENANKLREMYKANEQAIVDAYAEAEKNKQDLYLGTAQYFDYVDNAAILPTAHATVRQLINEWIGGSGKDGFVTAVSTAITELEKIQDQYAQKTAVILTEAGINYQKLKENGVDPTIDSLEDLVDTNEELSYALEDVNDLLDEQQYNLYQCEMAYYRLRDAAVNAVYSANSALNQLAQTAISTAQQVQAAIQSAQNAASIASSLANTARSLGSGVGSGIQSSPTNNTSYYSKYKTSAIYQGVGKGSTTAAKVNKNANTTLEKVKQQSLTSNLVAGFVDAIGWSNIERLTESELKRLLSNFGISFDTGGYTGEWDNSGKLAMLHQKELVLNQSDTSNMLQAVELLRDMVNNQGNIGGIADMIIKSTTSQAAALAQINSGLLQHMASMVTTSNISNSRNMTVNADFSGVRSADAIYQALMELQNYGLQQNYSVDPMSSTPY